MYAEHTTNKNNFLNYTKTLPNKIDPNAYFIQKSKRKTLYKFCTIFKIVRNLQN
jgi:hypothetical protein